MEAQAKKWFSYNIENVNRKYFKFLKESYNWSELNETIFILNRITIEDRWCENVANNGVKMCISG